MLTEGCLEKLPSWATPVNVLTQSFPTPAALPSKLWILSTLVSDEIFFSNLGSIVSTAPPVAEMVTESLTPPSSPEFLGNRIFFFAFPPRRSIFPSGRAATVALRTWPSLRPSERASAGNNLIE